MKYLLILSIALLAACGGNESSDTPEEPPEELTDIEICLDQGGSWEKECVYPGEYCEQRALCKTYDFFCPCVKWARIKD